MSPAHPLRVAAIGLGWVTLNRHVPSIRRTPGLKLVGVIDRDLKKAEHIGNQLGVPLRAGADDLAHVPWLDQVDAITIGTAPFAHCALACAALKAGKHVLTEKPFAMTVIEGEQMERMATTRVLAVMHNFQFARALSKLERDLRDGRLGTVHGIDAVQFGNPRRRLPAWFEQLPFGLFYDESPHFFYLLHRLAGGSLTLKQAAHWRSRTGHATPDQISLTYASLREGREIPVSVNCRFDAAISEWHITVHGSDGTGIVDIFRDIYIFLPNDKQHKLLNILGTSLAATAQHWAQHVPNGIAYLQNRLDYGNDEVFSRFATACRAGQPPTAISASDALAVLRLQHAAIEAAKANPL